MSIHTSTMSNYHLPSERRPGFFRKLVVLIAFVVGIASFMVLLDYYQTNIPPFLMTIFALLGTGLAAGAGARTVFYKGSGFVRFVLTLIVLLLGLFVLGFFTNWKMGIGPLEPWLEGRIDWQQLVHLGGALLVALLALEAWWQPASKRVEAETPDFPRSSRYREQSHSPIMSLRQQPVGSRQAQIQSQESVSFPSNPIPRLKLAGRSRTRSRTMPKAERPVLAHTAQHTRSRSKRAYKRKPNLQISLYEEHRCPFCLEEVKRNDPRGVKKCEVCNTLHHADCWAITGFCQVPHLNT